MPDSANVNELVTKSVRNTSKIQKYKNLLLGKLFYLHLPECMQTEKLASKLTLIGGVIDKFFHKDIDVLVVNQRKTTDEPCTSKSTFDETGLPRYRSRILQFLRRNCSDHHNKHDLVRTAEKWGIQIKSLTDLNNWLHNIEKGIEANEKFGKERPTLRMLRGMFLKVEDMNGKYRPLVKEFQSWPKFNVDNKMTPLDQNHDSSPKSILKTSVVQKKRATRKRKSGYCEPCAREYEDLAKHLQGKQHKTYANNKENFKKLDDVVNRGADVQELRRYLPKRRKVTFSKRKQIKLL